ncbi:FCD domain-containing protein [Nocardiopsis suaedae]|uniref:FCD domain-containing protein n=1 Tax=Nocardiopsis suaedae TaxID=3018444 RepID=A0ABT4TR85_9ACTN|nr:FCD domain-containing protein [Nocardiopsis suaedae]MDA2806870.1 FCD domain-containing protein [Nocardiopsis suaedae]
MVGRLRDQARMRGPQKLADRGELTDSAQEHEAIVEAVAARDADLTAEPARRHLAHSRGIRAGAAESRG